jgi:hypothetical protein
MNSALKNEKSICDTVCRGKPACKVEVEVEVEAKASCTLGGNSELFLANCSIGSMNSALKNELPIAILCVAESQLAGAVGEHAAYASTLTLALASLGV